VARFRLENGAPGAHSPVMELILSKITDFLAAVCMAGIVALAVGYIAHYDFGLSRLAIRMVVLIGAGTIVPLVLTLLAIEHFEKLGKPK
jgi:hypothetical protein